MKAVEFTTDLGDQPVLNIPREIADRLPKEGQVRVIILTAEDPEDKGWQESALLEFARGDDPEDSVYDSF